MRLLFEAQSIMERDALVARLQDAGIECHAEHRDLSRRITNNTVDISYEGISAVQGGFKLSVLDEDFEAANKVIIEFKNQTSTPNLRIATPINHFDKFYSASLFSLVLIIVPITFPIAFYHLFKTIQSKEKFSLIKMLFALTLLLAIGACFIFFLYRN